MITSGQANPKTESMGRTLSEVISGLPRDQQQEIEARAAQLIEDETTLRDQRQ